jgi:gliding motility-associated protein GldC
MQSHPGTGRLPTFDTSLTEINMSTKNEVARRSNITIGVELNDEKQPVGLQWKAEDSGIEGEKAAKAMMLAIWDKMDQSSMRIDLWTHEMTVEEMEFFFYQTLASMADTYQRSTGDQEYATELRNFAQRFGKDKKVIK